eukprot:COSAG02_NODE_12035_length_1609_cov_1.443794_1_plen_263_part_10
MIHVLLVDYRTGTVDDSIDDLTTRAGDCRSIPVCSSHHSPHAGRPLATRAAGARGSAGTECYQLVARKRGDLRGGDLRVPAAHPSRSEDCTPASIRGLLAAAAQLAAEMHAGHTHHIGGATASSVRRLQKLAEPLLASAADVSSEDAAAGPDSWSCTDLPAPTVTEHEMADGTAYTATAGLLPIVLEETEGAKGSIFFAAYTLPQPKGATPRPLTFLFNGGPGSSSIWLHLSGIGPKMVELLPDGGQPAPPYALIDSGDACWL